MTPPPKHSNSPPRKQRKHTPSPSPARSLSFYDEETRSASALPPLPTSSSGKGQTSKKVYNKDKTMALLFGKERALSASNSTAASEKNSVKEAIETELLLMNKQQKLRQMPAMATPVKEFYAGSAFDRSPAPHTLPPPRCVEKQENATAIDIPDAQAKAGKKVPSLSQSLPTSLQSSALAPKSLLAILKSQDGVTKETPSIGRLRGEKDALWKESKAPVVKKSLPARKAEEKPTAYKQLRRREQQVQVPASRKPSPIQILRRPGAAASPSFSGAAASPQSEAGHVKQRALSSKIVTPSKAAIAAQKDEETLEESFLRILRPSSNGASK